MKSFLQFYNLNSDFLNKWNQPGFIHFHLSIPALGYFCTALTAEKAPASGACLCLFILSTSYDCRLETGFAMFLDDKENKSNW